MSDKATATKPKPEDQPAAESASEATDDTSSSSSRIALIWVPGLYRSANTTVDAVARRLAYALDRRAKTPSARFSVAEKVEEIDRGNAGKIRRASILRRDGDDESPAIDVFELDYADTLVRPHLDATALLRWIEATWVVIISFFLALGAYRHSRGKTLLEKLQLVFGALWLIMLVAYVWLLFLALIVAINTLFEIDIWSWLGFIADNWEGASKFIGALLVLVLGTSATVPAMRARLERAGAATISSVAYLRIGRQRAALTGQLADLVEHIAEESQAYRRIDLVANSFGSLIVLDAVFPHGAPPEPRFAMVKGMVTIGCPYDAVRAFWPGYAEDRRALEGAPAGWLNVYSPLDVFGSNFRDDNLDKEPTVVVAEDPASMKREPTNLVFQSGQGSRSLTLFDVLVFNGFRSHTRYWGDQEEAENTVFNAIVSELFTGDPVLK